MGALGERIGTSAHRAGLPLPMAAIPVANAGAKKSFALATPSIEDCRTPAIVGERFLPAQWCNTRRYAYDG